MKHTERYITSMHEATHAVLRASFGLKFWSVEIFPKRDERRRTLGAYGIINHGRRDALSKEQVHAVAIANMGPVYTHLRLELNETTATLLRGSCNKDFREVQRAAAWLEIPVEQIQAEAEVAVGKLWPAIRKVGSALNKEWMLSYEDVLDFCC